MFPRIVQASYVGDFTVWLRFSDGLEGKVDLSQDLHGEVFGPLRDAEFFQSFQLHPELRTLVWPNGADFAPEFLRDKLKIAV